MILFIISLVFGNSLFSQNVTDGYPIFYSIAPAYNFKSCILSLTFDYWFHYRFSIGIPLLDERKLPATFYVTTWQLGDSLFRQDLINVFNNGQEIGSHKVSHPNLSSINKNQIVNELQFSNNQICLLLPLNKWMTFAYLGGLIMTLQ